MDEGWTDNVARMRALIEAHPGWTWTQAPAIGADHVVTYPLNGASERAAHNDLGKLCTYMEAVAKATMSTTGTAAADACAECGHLTCDCCADMGDDATDSIAEGHDADVAATTSATGR